MREQITYILGAGASYHSIPIVNTMNQRMLMFLNLFKEFKNYKDSPGTVFISTQASLKDMYKPYLHQGFEKYREVVEEAVKHYTVDTYARKLWLQNKKIKLKTLKEFLCLFFAFEQSSRSDKLPNIYDKQSEYGVNETHIHTPLDYSCLLYTSPSPRD